MRKVDLRWAGIRVPTRKSILLYGLLFLVVVAVAAPASAGTLGGGMSQLVQLYEANSPKLQSVLQIHITKPQNIVLVDVHLQPGVPASQALADLAKTGFQLKTVSYMDPRLVEGFLPLGAARSAAAVAGVRSIAAVARPLKSAGSVQSQAVAVEKADKAQARGIDGTGVKIGVLSDSYNYYATEGGHPDATDDVNTGDLPAGVVVLEDLPAGQGGEDEGRAMMQLVHDIAPGASLGFATAFIGEVDFSNNMLDLHRKFGADVVVDDVIYYDEPMFSDGLLAQTVDQIVSEGGTYFSSAGNNGLEGYQATYDAISFAKAQKLVKQGQSNLNLQALIDRGLAPKSFHNFGDDHNPVLSQPLTSFFGDILDFQWDEPFYLDKVKTDYNIYLFDANGNYLDPTDPNSPVYFSTDNNIDTDTPMELAQVLPGNYQIVIGKMNNGPAQHLKYVVVNGNGESKIQNAPTTWGHAAARTGQGVAAMYYGITDFPEDFSSPGPVTIYLDKNGNRLRFPEIRQAPQITGIDGVDTTFFGGDTDGNGLPNFFGTSAAAPDVAAVAALVLEKKKNLSPAQVYRKLQDTATRVPLSADRALAGAQAGAVLALATGDFSRVPTYWRLAVLPITHHSVSSVSINLTNTSTNMLWSNPLGGTGFVFGESSGVAPADVTVSRSTDRTTLTLTFAPGKFKGGEYMTFANFAFPVLIPFQFPFDADRVEGAQVTVTYDDNSTKTGTFKVAPKLPVNNFTGAGLVNADAATSGH